MRGYALNWIDTYYNTIKTYYVYTEKYCYKIINKVNNIFWMTEQYQNVMEIIDSVT